MTAMDHDLSPHKALDKAYRLLASRPHTQTEIKQKLARKGFSEETITAVLSELTAKGYINEEEMALRWAQALVRDKLWGPLKIAAWLMQKGISRIQIQGVQRRVWQEFDEREVARRATAKRFSNAVAQATPAKKAAFLRARGFSADAIYAVVRDVLREDF